MKGLLNHERAYRTAAALDQIAATRIVLCGAGAVGSNLAHHLARQGFTRLAVVDRERVDAPNLTTQTYRKADIGARKAVALRNDVFRIAGVEIEAHAVELDERNAARLLANATVIVDGFDNAASRALVSRTASALGIPALHVGLAADYGEVVWDPLWICPSGQGEDVCDYPLARSVIQLACVVAAEALVRFAIHGRAESFTITLGDLGVRPHGDGAR